MEVDWQRRLTRRRVAGASLIKRGEEKSKRREKSGERSKRRSERRGGGVCCSGFSFSLRFGRKREETRFVAMAAGSLFPDTCHEENKKEDVEVKFFSLLLLRLTLLSFFSLCSPPLFFFLRVPPFLSRCPASQSSLFSVSPLFCFVCVRGCE